MAETTKKTTAEKNPGPAVKTPADTTLEFMAATGLAIDGRYKSVYVAGTLAGNVVLRHIIFHEAEPDNPALVFSPDGQLPPKTFTVIRLKEIQAFTIATS